MNAQLYFLFAAGFVVIAAFLAAISVRISPRFGLFAILCVLGSATLAYEGTDQLLGRAHTTKPMLGWHKIDLGNGATVYGVSLDKDAIYLMLQEDGDTEPKLYAFPNTVELLGKIKRVMGKTALATHGATSFGFRITSHPGHGEATGNDSSTSFDFHEPKPVDLPPKDAS